MMKVMRALLYFITSVPVLAAIAWLLGSCLPAVARSAETYTIDGKPVSKQVYDAQRLANEGENLLKSGNFQQALVKLERAVSMAPELSHARHNLGMTLGKLGRTEEAIEQMEKSLTLTDDTAPGLLSLAGLYQSKGRLKDAIATYKTFVKQYPSRPEVPRLKNILTLLERQLARQSGAPSQPGNPHVVANDYYLEVTRNGIRRWPDSRLPLKVFIEPGDGVPGFQPSFEASVRQCFLDWESASSGRIRFSFLSEPKGADVTCAFTDDRKQLKNPAEGAEALTYDDGRGNLTKARVVLMTINFSNDKPRSDNQIRLLALHEIGHALGLGGHSVHPDDVMFYSSSFADTHRTLTERDRNTLTRLYSQPPGTGIAERAK